MHCGYMNLQCCVKYVHKLRNRTSSPSNLRTRSPQVQSGFAWLVWHCAPAICYSKPGFATINPDLLQLPRFCFFFSNLFRLNLWKIITLRYDIGWRWFLYENYSPRRDLQFSNFEFFHLTTLMCSKKLYKITAP